MGQQLNNNLDALFQKAAEDYPLKTDNKNWDIVAAKLQTALPALAHKKSRKWPYAVLLLLLLTGGFFVFNNMNKKQPNSDKHIFISQETISKKNQQTTEPGKKIYEGNSNNQVIKIKPLSNKILKSSRLPYSNKIVQHNLPISNISIYPENKSLVSTNNNQQVSTDNNEQVEQIKLLELSSLSLSAQNKINQSQEQKSISEQKNVNAGTVIDNNSEQNSNKPNTTSEKKSVHFKLKPQSNTFYGTFFFSPDFSTVKFQRINKPGYTIGVALGYRISNRVSAEIGLQRLHNNFYSDGRYFDKSNLKLKPTTVINAVNGSSKLTEVPIAIRYNILKHSDHFFATAGTTVALITHTENYSYNITRGGSPDNISRKFNSLNGTKYFSTVNAGIGYEVTVSRFFKLKAEPYYQAPIGDFGIGSLPVANFGVNIGIVKDLK